MSLCNCVMSGEGACLALERGRGMKMETGLTGATRDVDEEFDWMEGEFGGVGLVETEDMGL